MNNINSKRYNAQNAAELLGINKRTIFNWEAAGKIPKAQRDPMNDYRYYSNCDVKQLRDITGR